MLILEVLPDEIARGYLGRLRAINGYRSQKETVRVLRQHLGEQYSDRRGSPVACLLAKSLLMSTEAFSQQHTMLPCIRAVTNHLPDMKHGEAGSEDVIRRCGMSSPKPGVCFCRSCVNEDMDYWGYAYFRRSHQLPGATCCEKHQEPLLWVADERAIDRSPYEFLVQSGQGECRFPASILDHSAIDRYLAITAHWLNAEKPIPTHQLFDVLHKRADSLGIRRARNGKRKLLSDRAIEAFPGDWLSSIFPNLLSKIPSEFYQPIDAVLLSGHLKCRSESYALALAILFETAENALNEISQSVSPPTRTRVLKRGQIRGFWRSQEFLKIYVEERGNPSHIASSTGLTSEYVKRMMRAVGLPALGNLSDVPLRACLDLVAGMSLYEACTKCGANPRVVEGIIPMLSDRFVSAIEAILSKQVGSAMSARRFEAEPVM